MKNIYENMYHGENRMELRRNPRVLEMIKIVDELNLKDRDILDIGCYDGIFLSMINNRQNNFYGLEASSYGYEASMKKGIAVQKFYVNDEQSLPYENDFFDLVAAGEVIEHIYDTDYFLREIKRVLKKDGRLIISTPNLASLGRRLLLLIGQNPLIESSLSPGNSGHIRYFTFNTLKALLASNGFKISRRASDAVNFSAQGHPSSRMLARLCPSLGQSIIYLAETCK